MDLQSIIIGLLVTGVFFVIASLRKGSSSLGNKPKRLKSFSTMLKPLDAFKAIIAWAPVAGYQIDEVEEEDMKLLLSSSATATTYGFFYPIFFSTNTSGTCLVEVGIKSKILQIGPIVSRNHEKCFNGIRAAVIAYQPTNQTTHQPSALASPPTVQQILICKDDNQLGPFHRGQLEDMLKSGMISTSDLAWHKGLANWIPIGEVLSK